MALYKFDLYTKAYPDITNRIKGSVLDWNETSIITAIIDDTAGHPERLWNYAGLPYANYVWSLDEINGGGIVIRNLARFTIVPNGLDIEVSRNKEQLQVDAPNSGLVSATNTATLDGTDDKLDFRGWKIIVAQYGDIRNILVEGLDYTWDVDTAELNLLQGEFFQPSAWWTFVFVSQTQLAGNSAPTIFDYSTRLITGNDTLDYTDFGNAVMCKLLGNYAEVNIPDITTIPVGREVDVEIGGTGFQCVKFVPFGTDSIGFLRGKLYGYPGESFKLVRYQYADLSNEWRVKSVFGNFARCGDVVGANQIQSGILLAKLCDGTAINKYQYARLYNEIVLNLPATQRVLYADHATGNNKYLFSAASLTPGNDNFFLPDYRGLWIAGNNTGKAGDFLAALTGEVPVPIPVADTYNGHFGTPTKAGSGNDNPTTVVVTVNPGQKSRPDTLLMNQYILI